MTEVRCVARGEDELGEGPAWSAADARIYWFDIQGKRLNWLSPADGARGGWDLPVRASVAIPSAGGGLVQGLSSRLHSSHGHGSQCQCAGGLGVTR